MTTNHQFCGQTNGQIVGENSNTASCSKNDYDHFEVLYHLYGSYLHLCGSLQYISLGRGLKNGMYLHVCLISGEVFTDVCQFEQKLNVRMFRYSVLFFLFQLVLSCLNFILLSVNN